MAIQLSDHFTYKKILRFCFPSIVMMIFTSVYGVVDGLFISNFVGKVPFAAINLFMRQRLGGKDAGRGKPRGGEPLFYDDGGIHRDLRRVFFGAGNHFHAPGLLIFRGDGRHVGGLRRVWNDCAGV